MQTLSCCHGGTDLDGGTVVKFLGLKCRAGHCKQHARGGSPADPQGRALPTGAAEAGCTYTSVPVQVIADKAGVEAALHKLEAENRQRAEDIRKAEAEAQEQMAKAAAAEQAQKRDLILQLRWLFIPGSCVGM